MPSKLQTARDSIALFNQSRFPFGQASARSVWLGIYQVLLWYENITSGQFRYLPHIIEANDLKQNLQWQSRAKAIEDYIARQLSLQPSQIPPLLGRLYTQPAYVGLQKNNITGIAFGSLIKYVLERFGNPALSYELEVPAGKVFPGIKLVGQSKQAKIDILVSKLNTPRIIISGKWSVRHDRVGDLINECPAYKAAATRQRATVDYIVVTNEFSPARLEKIIDDSCIDSPVHVHKDNIINVCSLNGRLTKMLDLADLIAASQRW